MNPENEHNRQVYETRYSGKHFQHEDGKGYFAKLFRMRLELVKQCAGGGRVLDVGCGSGAFLIPLAKSGCRVVGLDFSAKLLEECRQDWLSRELPAEQLEIHHADACQMPLESGQFDCAFSFSTLYTIPRQDSVLAEMARVLKPGGRAILDFGNISSLNALEARRVQTGVQTFHLTCEVMLELLRQHGFAVRAHRCFQFFPLWGGATPQAQRVNLILGQLLGQEVYGTLLDELISSAPLLNEFAFRHIFLVEKVPTPAAEYCLPAATTDQADSWSTELQQSRRQAAAAQCSNGDLEDGLGALVEILKENPADALTVAAIAELYDHPDELQMTSQFRSRVQVLASRERPKAASVPAKAPCVSVVLPTYNHLRYLPAAIESLLAQTFKDFELVIVNDGSTDGTREYLDTLKDPRIRVIHQANQRLPKALNAGFAVARGELLSWTSSDNYCAPIFLEALVAALDAHPQVGIACGAFASVDENSRITNFQKAPDMTLRNALRGNPGNAAFLYRRICQDTVGCYATDLEGAEDWDMWLRIVERFPVVQVEETLYYYRRHEHSMTVKLQSQISTACGLAFQRALERLGGLDVDRLYPTLRLCHDKAAAEATALYDLGTQFLRSAIVPPELTARVLSEAFDRRATDEVLANLSLAYARCGRWSDVQRCLGRLASNTQPQIQRVTAALWSCSASSVVPEVKQIQPLTVRTSGEELFELEKESRLTFSLTRQDATLVTAPQSQPLIAPTATCVPVSTPLVQASATSSASSHETLYVVERKVREALAINPDGVDALKLAAQLCFQRGQWLEASRASLRVVELAPQDVGSLLVLAKCFFELGDHVSVRSVLERALEIQPDNQIARDNLAQLDQVQAAAQARSAHLQQLLVRGQMLLEKGDITGARHELEQAVKLPPQDADLHVSVGNLQAEQGDINAARTSYSRALQAEPKHADARERLVGLTINGGDAAAMATKRSEVAGGGAFASDRGVVCPVCDARLAAFEPYGNPPRPNAICPRCRTLERHRLLCHYLAAKTPFLKTPLRLLDFAPIKALSEKFRSLPNIDYLSVDLMSPVAMRRMDITRLELPDESFDVIFCLHVLEHIPDDAKAMSELFRVLKPGGWAILLVPLDLNSATTREGRHITDSAERLRLFGQDDHVRLYGLDFKDRLTVAGFEVTVDSFVKELPEGEASRLGLLRHEDVYFCAKPLRAVESAARSLPGTASLASVDAPGSDNAATFAHLQRGFDLLAERRFTEAQEACREYQRLIRYDELSRTDNRNEAAPQVSVVIVAYKINQGLIQCLDSLAASTNPPHEVIVVDNGGNEAIHAELGRRPVLHIRVGFNVILAEGRNIGVHFARSNYAVFIDDDALAAPGYLASALEGFQAFDVHAFRGKVLPKSDHPHNSRARHYNLGDLPFPADIDTEGNSAFRIDTWRKLGGQDPLLFGGEGVDLSYRIGGKHGDCSMMYWPFMVIRHDYAVTDGKLETKNSRHVLMREYSLFKHPDLREFHNRIVAFARSPDTKAGGQRLLLRRSAVGATLGAAKRVADTKGPCFSVCMPTYNRAAFIEQALASVFAQTYQNFELVVVDDGSTDDTAAVMKRISDPRVRFIVKEHSGGPETRNRCIAEARGEFLVWLDSDDVLLPGTLEIYAQTLAIHPDVDVLYGHLQVADEHLKVTERWDYNEYHGWGTKLLSDTVVENRIPNVCTLVRKSCYAKVGGYNPAFPRAHDYEFWTRLAPVAVFKSVNAEVGIYRRHEQSLSKVRQQVNTSYEANAVKAMVERHPLRSLFPFCHAPGSPERSGDARAWLLTTLLMVKYGDLPAALEYAKRSEACADLGLNRRVTGLLQVVTGKAKSFPGPKVADEFGSLVEQAAKLFAKGQVQPCAKACAQLTELRPDAVETLLLVGLSLQRWSDPSAAKTGFRYLVRRQCERAHLEAVNEAEASLLASPPPVSPLAARLAAAFAVAAIPATAVAGTVSFVAAAASAADVAQYLAHQQEGQTPLLSALLALSEAELTGYVEPAVVAQIARVRAALQPMRPQADARQSGYSFCLITAGQRRDKLARQVASIHALRLPAYEILIGGSVAEVPHGVRKVDMAEAAQAGRLGKMRNELGRRALYDHLVVADDDLVFGSEFGRGLERFGEGYDAMAVRIVNPDGSRFWDWATTGGTKGSVLLDYWDVDPQVYITGGICVLKTAVLDRVAWDEARGFYEREDVDFSTRLKASGLTIRFNTFCQVLHDDDRYSRVERRIFRFDHLLDHILQCHESREHDEVRRYLGEAVRMARTHSDREDDLRNVAQRVGEETFLAQEFARCRSPQGAEPFSRVAALTQAQTQVATQLVAANQSVAVAAGAATTNVNWIGSFLDHGSLSHVNRELTQALMSWKNIQLQRTGSGGPTAEAFRALAPAVTSTVVQEAAVTVRHAWPPNWERPGHGKLVVIQPWEFGSLPTDWVNAAEQVDEFWLPSEYVRRVYAASGVPANKLVVVPNGIDPEKFHPDAAPMALATNKSFRFLFVGGTIYRKGPDLLLKSYLENFDATDDVCLVIKDFGGQSVYAGQTFEAQIRAAQARPNAPEILYLNEELPPAALPGLYTACQCFVLPYRGEGFGLPVLEAMACGLPVIVTAGGATDDFVRDEFGWRVPAERRAFGREVSGMKLAGTGWLLEPDLKAIGTAMRAAFDDPRASALRGRIASRHAQAACTWQQAATIAAGRIRELATNPGSMPEPPVAGGRRAQNNTTIKLPACALVGHLGEARQFLQQKKLPAAWGAVRAALKHRPFHPEAYLLLAEIALAAHDAVAARACAQFARHIAPDFKPAKKFLKASLHGNLKPDWLVLPDTIRDAHVGRHPHLSVCLIVKNEERFLGKCLESVEGLADQIVVVDTGSTDRTVEIAKQHKAEVHSFAWCDDFSAARNAALEYVTGDWVLMLDADEELPMSQHEALRKLLRAAPVISWRLPLQDVGREAEGCSYVPRLFRNAPGLFYVGRVHEQVFTSLEVRRQEWGLETRMGDATLRHYGYTKELTQERDKVGRNLRLLEKAVLETPGEANLLMNYGLELTRSGRSEEGLRQYRAAYEALADEPPALVVPESREMLLSQFCTQLMAAKRHAEIVQVLTSPVAKLGVGLTASLHFALGLAQMELKDFATAAEQFRQCLAKRERPALTPVNVEIRKAGPRHCLALCLAQTNGKEAAEREFQAARKDDPESVPVVSDYARFLHEQGRAIEALQLLHPFTAEHPQAAAAWLSGGAIALSQPEFLEVAVDWTAEALRHFPEDVGIQSQRAEALLLAGQPAEALPLWRKLAIGGKPSSLGALILCETAVEKNVSAPPPELAGAVTQEFVRWYRRLLDFGAEPTVVRVNAGVAGLGRVLPRAAELLRAVIAEAGTPTAG